MSVLILRLCGPMQSWGTQSRFSVRDSGREPSKSGVAGLLAAALGWPRSHDLGDLMQIRMAVRIDRPGALRRDYQTAGGGKLPGGRDYGVAKANAAKPATVTSCRYYLADADFRVALAGEAAWLAALEESLENPRWPLYLGRKAFVPNYPVCLGVRNVPAPLDALKAEPWFFRSPNERKLFAANPECRAVVEVTSPADADDIRQDHVASFATRDFLLRHVKYESIPIRPELIQPDSLTCSSPN